MQAIPLPIAIKRIRTYIGDNAKCSGDNPIFVLSAGWRSGSTLLQRLVISSGSAMIWGEPFGPASIVNFMTEPLRRIPNEISEERFLRVGQDVDAKELSAKNIANLYPTLDFVQDAHVQYWNAMLAEPARKLGFERWGFKEVRLSIDHAGYLKWLYPNCKIICLYRNPYDAYISYMGFKYRWFHTWPELPVTSADEFGRHWQWLVAGFIARAAEVDAQVVRFEDLQKNGEVVQQLANFLDLNLDTSVLDQRIGEQKNKYMPTDSELQSLFDATSPTLKQVGYTIPGL